MNFLRKGRGQPKALLLAWLSSWLLVLPSLGQQPVAAAAPGRVSEAQLRYFLSRALTLQGAVEISGTERRQVLPWAGRLGTRFAGRVGGFWEVPRSDAQERAWYDSTRLAVRLLRATQPDIVVQGAIFEVVQAQVSNLMVPNSIRAEFGEDTLHPAHRHFSLAAMMYPGYFTARDSAHYRWDDRPPGEAPGVPDMSRPETQMWFYFCARRQLDAGCEALHFGQVTLMDDRDPGHRAWWSMLTRVRQYARQRNRGFVLCDAHTHASFYDPDPQHPLPDSARQLLFDFHASPMRPFEADTLRHGQHGTYLDYARWEEAGSALYKLSAGGRTPSGWHCARLPALVELDNGGSAIPYKPGQWPWTWGLDEISWFANQPAAYRNEWLVYAAARVPQLDPDVYPEFPAMRIVRVPGQPDRNYRADLEGQGPTLSRIWRGETTAQGRRLILVGPPAPPAGSLLVGPQLPD